MEGARSGDVFRVWKTLLSLLRNRGYAINEEDIGLNKDAFDRRFIRNGGVAKDLLGIKVAKANEPEQKLMVKWTDGAKVGVHPIRGFYEELKDQDVQRGILVVETSVSPFAKQAMLSFRPNHIMESFSYAELKFDITTHKMVPHHKILSKKEKASLLEKLGVRETQLPRMQTSDPVARYYGLERGTVVEITRKSDTSGLYVTYRIVTS